MTKLHLTKPGTGRKLRGTTVLSEMWLQERRTADEVAFNSQDRGA
jgi:hypothetical protein